MMTPAGPKVLEFNCRFGDPEAQPLLMRLRSDLADVLEATVTGKLDHIDLHWDPRPAVCVVMASEGYPGAYEKGRIISGLDEAAAMPDVKVYHAGTARLEDRVVTNGGRVLGVTALGETVTDARARANQAAERIHFEGAYYRRDIAARAD
jgi:phosphoribosylamine--glycine ligase